jgi:hypothetical protein
MWLLECSSFGRVQIRLIVRSYLLWTQRVFQSCRRVYIGFRRIILRIDAPPRYIPEIVPGKIRLLSVVTGCFTAIAGSLVLGLFFSIPPIILVLGSITQPHLRVVGKWLIGVGAVLLSLEVMVLVVVIPEGVRLLRLYHDRGILGTISFSVLSVVLVTWCDVVLVIDARRPRQTP